MICMAYINAKKEKILTMQKMKCINYLNPDKKHCDSGYTVELYLPGCQMLKVGEDILIIQKVQEPLHT